MFNDFFRPLVVHDEDKLLRFFNGREWKESESGNKISIHSPIDGSLVGVTQGVSHNEVDDVLAHARQAQHLWETTPLYERVKKVKRAADLIREHQELFVDTLVKEIGKSKEESKSEVVRTADLIEYFAHEVQSLTGQYASSDAFFGFSKGRYALIDRVAHGVVLAIGPFNYPINLVASKIAPALLMGNAVVIKPPTQGSIVGLLLTQVFVEAKIPEGVISCLTGQGKEIGNYLVSHDNVSMVAFTGSSAIGQDIAKRVGMKPLLFECGGNNPAYVYAHHDLQTTAKEIVKGAFSYAGQRCTGMKYVLADSQTIETLLPEVLTQLHSLVKLGNPLDEGTKLVGPVISEAAAHEIEEAVQESVAQGAEIVSGGRRQGLYMEPTILKHVKPEMRVVAQEIFGPVVSFVEVSGDQEAEKIINNSAFGLQASIFTTDEGSGIALAQRLNVGAVQINGSPQRGPDHFPFMGVKTSGIGVQGVKYSLEAMSRLKSIVLNNPQ